MFSRIRTPLSKQLIGLASVMALLLTSCTPPLVGEQPPPQKAFKMKSKCFNKAARDLKAFFSAEVDNDTLQSAWGCLSDSFLEFQKYVKGREQDRYTSAEIVTFLENNFFEDNNQNKITPELQVELMKLKQIFIGGSTQYVTREELKSSQEFFGRISRMTVKINPYMNIIMMLWKPHLDNVRSEDLQRFDAANKAAQEFAKELAQIIIQNKSTYKIDDALLLFQEFEKFFNTQWSWLPDVQKLFPGIKKLKIALAGGDENTINEQEWNPVLTLGVRGYFQFLRYRYFIKTTYETGGAIRLVYMANMMEDVFSIFQELLSQKSTGAVSSNEIYEILKAFESFWPDLKVSEKLIAEFMKIKKVVIGGSVENWSSIDFENARQKVPELRRILENFMPYYSIYSAAWDPQTEDPTKARDIFDQSRVRLSSIAQDFGHFLVGSYSYDDFISLVTELNRLYPNINKGPSDPSHQAPAKPLDFAQKIAQYRDVFQQVKSMVFGESDVIVRQDEWVQILPLVAQSYSLFQYYDYFLADKSFRQDQGIQDLGQLMNNTVGFAHDLLRTTRKGYFTQDEMVNLTLRLSDTSLFSQKIRPETAQGLWKAVLQYMLFSPEKRLAGETNDRLTTEQFEILRSEFTIWRKTQIVLNGLFDHNPEKGFSPSEMLEVVRDSFLKLQSDPDLKIGLLEIFKALQSPVSSTWNSEDELEVSNRYQWQYKMNALFQMNLTRGLTRLLMRSFSTEKDFSRLTKCEAQSAFDMIAGLFKDLKIFDPKPTFISSRFLEANIFLPHSNGDKFLDSGELSDLMNVIFSGLRVNSRLESSLRNVCKIYKDADGKEFVTFNCLSEHHYVTVRRFMTQLPDFKSYVESLAAKDTGKSLIMPSDEDNGDLTHQEGPNPEDPHQPPAPSPGAPGAVTGARPGFATWNTVFKQTLKATGWIPNNGYGDVKEESVYLSDSLYYPFVVQYTELLYARFDSSRNGYLQAPEAIKAFPIFESLLRDVAADSIKKGLIKNDEVLSLFTYILRYKDQPDFWHYITTWQFWKKNVDKWNKEIWVGRTDMAQILGFIADKTRESGSSGTAPVCDSRASRISKNRSKAKAVDPYQYQ